MSNSSWGIASDRRWHFHVKSSSSLFFGEEEERNFGTGHWWYTTVCGLRYELGDFRSGDVSRCEVCERIAVAWELGE